MDSTSIYNALLPHCKPGFEKTLWVYIRFCVEQSQPDKTSECENHHILPGSLFPEYKNLNQNQWNKSRLFYRDHFRAHKMLARCIGGKMSFALWQMIIGRWNGGYQISLQEYEIARKSHVQSISKLNKGKTFSDESRRKISEARKGKALPKETRQKISKAAKGKTHSTETRKKMSESRRGRTTSQETRQKLSESGKGNQRALGYKHSKETLKQISESQKGKVYSKEFKQSISETLKNKPKVTCPHCDKEGASSIMKRWHFDNCRFRS